MALIQGSPVSGIGPGAGSAYANALAKRDVTLARFLSRYFEEGEVKSSLSALFEQKLAADEVLLLLNK